MKQENIPTDMFQLILPSSSYFICFFQQRASLGVSRVASIVFRMSKLTDA